MDRLFRRGYTDENKGGIRLRLMATCCPGLEFALAGEIAGLLRAECSEERGKVSFEGDCAAALGLGCADNLYAYVGGVRVGRTKADLPAMAAELAELPVYQVIGALAERGVSPAAVHLSASRSGKHSFSRFEAADAALAALCRSLGAEAGNADRHTCALRLDIQDEGARLYVKFTPPEFRFRGKRAFSPAAVRPTVARALVRLTRPRAEDRFLDPFCGSGTFLQERAAFPALSIAGGDISPEAAAAAARNAPGCEARVWDARMLPLEEGTVDAVATNPPWGKQIAAGDERELYRSFVRELRRVGSPELRAVVLTDRGEAVTDACAEHGLSCDRLAIISLHGTLAGIYRIARIT